MATQHRRTHPRMHKALPEPVAPEAQNPSDQAKSSSSEPHRDPRRIPSRTLLFAALGISLMTLVVAVLWRAESDRLLSRNRQELAATINQRQEKLERRVSELAAHDAGQIAALETRLRLLDAARTAAPVSSSAAPSPFAIENVLSSIVQVVCLDNAKDDVFYSGSGTMVDRKGLIVTNRHILESSDASLITYCGVGWSANLSEPPTLDYIAALRAENIEDDLALLQIIERVDGGELPGSFPEIPLEYSAGVADGLHLGDTLFIGGYPGIGAETFTYTQGVVSGRLGDSVIKTSALIDSGTSGGAAFTKDGIYVGVPTAAVRGEIGGSLGYLVSASVVQSFLDDFRRSGPTPSTPFR